MNLKTEAVLIFVRTHVLQNAGEKRPTVLMLLSNNNEGYATGDATSETAFTVAGSLLNGLDLAEATVTFEIFKANTLKIHQAFWAIGIPTFQTTLNPRSSSTDKLMTFVNQTLTN